MSPTNERPERPVWDAERIARAREDCRVRTDVYHGEYIIQSSHFISLLDELERVRQDKEKWQTAYAEREVQLWDCSARLASAESKVREIESIARRTGRPEPRV